MGIEVKLAETFRQASRNLSKGNPRKAPFEEKILCGGPLQPTNWHIVLASPGSSSPSQRLGVWFSAAISTRLPPHTHLHAELNLLMAGRATVRTASGSHVLGAGDLFVLPGGLEHQLVEASSDMAMWVLELGEGVEGRADLHWLENCAALTPTVAFRKQLVTISRKLWLRPSEPRAKFLEAALLELLAGLELGADACTEPQHPAVARAREVCESEANKLSIQALASRVGLSASRLAHLFQAELGLTPLQYRNFVRLQRFIQTQESGPSNLLRHALESGFGSYAQFHRVFHQVCGTPPGAHLRWLETDAAVDASRTMG